MHNTLKQFYRAELAAADEATVRGNCPQAFIHLERAHILSQRFALAHAATHLRMLKLGWRTRDGREVRGHLTRALAALLFSRIWVSVGNTGARMSARLRPCRCLRI